METIMTFVSGLDGRSIIIIVLYLFGFVMSYSVYRDRGLEPLWSFLYALIWPVGLVVSVFFFFCDHGKEG